MVDGMAQTMGHASCRVHVNSKSTGLKNTEMQHCLVICPSGQRLKQYHVLNFILHKALGVSGRGSGSETTLFHLHRFAAPVHVPCYTRPTITPSPPLSDTLGLGYTPSPHHVVVELRAVKQTVLCKPGISPE